MQVKVFKKGKEKGRETLAKEAENGHYKDHSTEKINQNNEIKSKKITSLRGGRYFA